jgi:hypothetical protein
MRGGVRLPAMIVTVIVTIGSLAGCSDPAGAIRKERAAARKSSPSPSASATKAPAPVWSQAPGKVRTAGGLRVHTGALHAGRMKVTVTDVNAHVGRTIVASARAHGATVGHFTLTGVKVAKNAKTGVYGLTFRYRHR